jgi:hypothetical protein
MSERATDQNGWDIVTAKINPMRLVVLQVVTAVNILGCYRSSEEKMREDKGGKKLTPRYL